MGVTFAFLQAFRHFCQLPWSKCIESCLAVTSPSSLGIYGYIPSKPMDSYVSNLPEYSLTRSSSTKAVSPVLQPFSLLSGTWDSWKLVFLVEAEGKVASVSQSFPCPVSPSPLSHLVVGSQLPWRSFCHLLTEVLLFAFDTLPQTYFFWFS